MTNRKPVQILVFTCLNLTTEALELGLKYVQS